MKVMLIRPPHTDFEGTEPPRIGIPLGALSIAAAMEQRGHEVKVFDALTYMDKTGDKNHFGASWERILGEIKKFNPGVIGIANLFSTQIGKALILPKLIRGANPEIKLIVGGPHATVRPQDFLNGEFDFVILAEGEETGPDIVDYYAGRKKLEEIKGIAYMDNGLKIHPPEYIKDLDKLPFPAYHLVDMEMYFTLVFNGFSSRPQDPFYRPRREMTMITSRGCPYICTFCSIHPTMGYKFRMQSAEYVLNHIEHVARTYNVELIHFEDDNLTLNPKRFEEILDGLEARNIHVEWDTPNGVRADTLTRPLLEKMKKAHVSELRIAIESGVQEVLDKVVKKSLDINKAIQAAKDCCELGIKLSAFYVIGMPGETKKDIETTLELAYTLMHGYNVTPHVNIAHPLVGTELYETAKEKGYLIDEDYTKGFIFGTGRIKTEEFSPEDLRRMSTDFYKKVRKLYLMKMIRSPRIIANNVKTFIRYPKSTLRLIKIAGRYTS
ncbi:MAG: B12-binding domain-containing radical SAM protein [Candidatus Aenigmarchaeota archaeon]|nr:B12-binding domain-containing radical SAM protein [Candidatus Aenigmarchaeota archaeon]